MVLVLPTHRTEVYDRNLGIKRTRFENGFVLYTMRMPKTRNSYVRLRAKVGPAYEGSYPHGISELVEHIIIDKRIFEFLDKIGGKANGHTYRHVTDIYARCKAATIPEVIGLFYRAIIDFEKSLEIFEAERGSIISERHMYDDRADEYLQDQVLLPAIFAGTPLERPELGSEEAYNSIGTNQIFEYQTKYWVPNNMAAAVVGSFQDEREIIEKFNRTFGRMEPKPVRRPKVRVPLKTEKILYYDDERDFRRLNFGIGKRVPGYGSEEAIAWKLFDGVLSGAGTGRLVTVIRGVNGLAYDPMTFYRDFGIMGAFFATMGTKSQNFEYALDTTLRILGDVKKGITLEELHAAKNYVLGEIDEILDDPKETAGMILDNHFFPSILYNLTSLQNKIKWAKRDDIIEIAQKLDIDNHALGIVIPKGQAIPEKYLNLYKLSKITTSQKKEGSQEQDIKTSETDVLEEIAVT